MIEVPTEAEYQTLVKRVSEIGAFLPTIINTENRLNNIEPLAQSIVGIATRLEAVETSIQTLKTLIDSLQATNTSLPQEVKDALQTILAYISAV